MSYDNRQYAEHEQFTEDRPSEPDKCPTCKGTGESRFDWINKTEKVINGYKFLSGVNVTYKPCECMQSDAQARHIIKQVEVTVEDSPPLPSVIYGECRGCHDETEITSDGYCYNC